MSDGGLRPDERFSKHDDPPNGLRWVLWAAYEADQEAARYLGFNLYCRDGGADRITVGGGFFHLTELTQKKPRTFARHLLAAGREYCAVLRRAGKWKKAKRYAARTLDPVRALHAANPAPYALALGGALAAHARQYDAADRKPAVALALGEEAIGVLSGVDVSFELAEALYEQGERLHDLGRADDAVESWTAALRAICGALAHRGGPDLAYSLAAMLHNSAFRLRDVGRSAEAEALLDAALSWSAYLLADPAQRHRTLLQVVHDKCVAARLRTRGT